VPVFVLGLLGFSNPAKKRRERENEFVLRLYYYHGKAVPAFRRTWQPHFRLNLNFFVFGYQAQLGGENSS